MKKLVLFVLLSLMCLVKTLYAEEVVKVGMLKLVSSAPLFIGMEKGFFKKEGIQVEPVYFHSAQPIAVALASNELDVAATGLTAGLFNLMSSGLKAKIVADKGRETQGFRLTALMVSNQAWEQGIRSIRDLKNKRIGMTQTGSTFHYILGQLLEKEGMSLKDVEAVPMGGLKNVMDALGSNQLPAGFVVQPHVALMESKGLAKVLLWVSDVMDYQIAAIIYGERLLKNRDLGTAFMKAYINSTRYYYENGLLPVKSGAIEKAADVAEIIVKYTEVSKEQVLKGLNYNHPEAELDEGDILKQLNWLYAQKLLHTPLKVEDVIDKTFLKDAQKALNK